MNKYAYLLITVLMAVLFCCCSVMTTAKTLYLPIPDVDSDDCAIVASQRTDVDWWIPKHEQKKTELANHRYDVLFLGDSITDLWSTWGAESWAKLELRHRIINLGFSGDKTENLLWRIQNGEFPTTYDPEYVVLLIGTNNSLRLDKPKSIAAGIGVILQEIHTCSPTTKILLVSILPRGITPNDTYRKNNERVNTIIQTYDGYLNISYIDVTGYFLNADKEVITDYYDSDMLHLNSNGFKVLTDVIEDYLD